MGDRFLSDAQLFADGAIARDVLFDQIVEQTAALADHLEQTAAAVVVVLVDLEMLVEMVDALGQNGDLHLGRAGIGFVDTVGLNEFLFASHHGHSPLF